MKFIAILVLGILIGCGVAGGYAYTLLQEAQQRLTAAETSRDAVSKAVKEQEEQLKGALAARSSLEAYLRASKAQHPTTWPSATARCSSSSVSWQPASRRASRTTGRSSKRRD